MSTLKRPPSVTTWWINLAGFFPLLITLHYFWPKGWIWEQQAALAIALVTLPILLLETLKRRREGTWPKPVYPVNWGRVVQKYVALITTFAIIAFFYWLLPHYHGLGYGHFYLSALAILPWMLPLAFLYLAYMDRITGDTPDGYSEFALLLSGDFRNRRWDLLKEHALGWTVKAFFLPLMLLFVIQNLSMQAQLQQNAGTNFVSTYFYLTHLTYFVDVAFATAGYVMTIRLFDSHIRSSEPTMLGWIVTLACYQPFWNFLYNHYFRYGWGGNWVSVLNDMPLLQMLWGSAIIILLVIYSWATVSFGVRFSNLTWRGLISNGPYRLCKHPAYLAKNLSWWLIAVPFAASGTWLEALQLSLLLLCVNFIYFMRAWTEEKHLCRYAEYREYCQWMSERGPLRFLPFPKEHWKNKTGDLAAA